MPTGSMKVRLSRCFYLSLVKYRQCKIKCLYISTSPSSTQLWKLVFGFLVLGFLDWVDMQRHARTLIKQRIYLLNQLELFLCIRCGIYLLSVDMGVWQKNTLVAVLYLARDAFSKSFLCSWKKSDIVVLLYGWQPRVTKRHPVIIQITALFHLPRYLEFTWLLPYTRELLF